MIIETEHSITVPHKRKIQVHFLLGWQLLKSFRPFACGFMSRISINYCLNLPKAIIRNIILGYLAYGPRQVVIYHTLDQS